MLPPKFVKFLREKGYGKGFVEMLGEKYKKHLIEQNLNPSNNREHLDAFKSLLEKRKSQNPGSANIYNDLSKIREKKPADYVKEAKSKIGGIQKVGGRSDIKLIDKEHRHLHEDDLDFLVDDPKKAAVYKTFVSHLGGQLAKIKDPGEKTLLFGKFLQHLSTSKNPAVKKVAASIANDVFGKEKEHHAAMGLKVDHIRDDKGNITGVRLGKLRPVTKVESTPTSAPQAAEAAPEAVTPAEKPTPKPLPAPAPAAAAADTSSPPTVLPVKKPVVTEKASTITPSLPNEPAKFEES